jgi:hypothetical protein
VCPPEAGCSCRAARVTRFANEDATTARAIAILIPGGLEAFLRAAVGPDRPRDAAAARDLERKHGLDFTPD